MKSTCFLLGFLGVRNPLAHDSSMSEYSYTNKRSADYLLLYPSFNNYDVLYDLRRKTGHNYVELMKLCGPKDNITSAFNNVGPPLRRNIFEVININDDADSD